ncbi:MAG: hypothetical protein IT161_00840 [Bryobacterales bacterium]|nr:hypothetical protein [Bryobacterales bacterium]
MAAQAQHLHTYLLFPFSVDKEGVMADEPHAWAKHEHWFDGIDEWIARSAALAGSQINNQLGVWKRASLKQFDMNSPAYQNMVFFHSFVRRVFFDTADYCGQPGEQEALLRSYTIPLAAHKENGRRIMLEARDRRGRSATIEVTELNLTIFANGVGILIIGVEATHIGIPDALWINETMRKVYPSSGRQVREGRTPDYMALTMVSGGDRVVILEEKFEHGGLKGYLPPLSKVITGLLYFMNYNNQEFEPILDERMIIYTYMSVDPRTVPANFDQSEDYEILMSRFLYVDKWAEDYRYDAEFTRQEMRKNVYRRWAHQGTLYGFTSYSNVTLVMGQFDCDEHLLSEGFLVHRMFVSRYYLMIVVALFYRATLLDFSERTALVSRALFRRFTNVRIGEEDIRLATRLMADFQFFSNYWYFSELATKDEEIEHFQLQCGAYRLERMKHEVEQEVDKLSHLLERSFQLRNTEAVNRLAMLSMILGGGAVITGFFGMNFGRQFEALFFNPVRTSVFHWAAIVLVTLIVVASLGFAVFLVSAGWRDYRTILMPRSQKERDASLRRTLDYVPVSDDEDTPQT